jgi:hypothetical protein
MEQMPDILFMPKEFQYLSFGEYEFASHRLVDTSYGITGWHRREGIVLLHGPPVQVGARLSGTRIEDIAPTVLLLMGQTPPSDMDGRVVTEALEQTWAARAHVTPASDTTQSRQPVEFSDTDEQVVRKRLRDLGYLA